MTRQRLTRLGFILVLALGALPMARGLLAQAASVGFRVAFARELPQLNGTHLKVTIVEVWYGPGESSEPHRHPCPVVGYVLQGALRTQAEGEAVAVYHAGESFYEQANRTHLVSANASATDSVRFLAYFTCDHEAPLSVAVPDIHH